MPADEAARKRGFWSLIATQFQGAFSDTAYKNLVVFLIVASASGPDRDRLVLFVGALFALPFILFSMTGGWLADRFSKRSVTIGTKVMEIAVMLLALASLALGNRNVQLTAVFLMSAQSALFGPSKYGLLPELLPQKKLSWGNGVLELGTFLAIILGTAAGSLLAEVFRGRQESSGAALVGLAVAGLLVSLGISRVPAADPAKKFRLNFLGDLFTEVGRIRKDRVLYLAVLGNTYFFFLGALLQLNITYYGTDVLQLHEARTGYLLATLALGMGLGSVAAGYLSGNKIEYGLIPLGSLGLTVLGATLGREGLSFASIATQLALLGFFAGFFIVPISALIQHRPSSAHRGGVIAAANLLSFIGIFLASGVYFLLQKTHLAPPDVFYFSAVVTLGATLYVLFLLPDSLLRLVLWMLTHTLYRIRVVGRDNIPEKGGALFVSNHLSMADAALVLASTDRPIRFLMFKGSYEHPFIKPFARIMRVIPVASFQRPRELIRALRDASEAIQSGEVVGIFAEGQMTRTGQMLPFRRGLERIMKGVEAGPGSPPVANVAPIIPVALDGVWGSIFSFERGRFLWKWPRSIPYPVTVSFGRPMPPTATATQVRQAVQELQAEAFPLRKERMRTLPRLFIRTARRHPFRFAMADGRVPRLNFGLALVRAIFLARRLAPHWRGQRMVGLLLPPSVGGALVNFSAMLLGKVPVNLNYTASNETLASCARQCGIETVVTSKAFLERVKLEVPGRTLLLEELAERPRLGEKLAAFLLAWALPARLIERACGERSRTTLGTEKRATLDDLATVIFSSGSTGEPKGVMLSHFNIVANVEQTGQVFALDHKDRILGILPFFHSFGFMATLALPAALGVGVVYHPNPLDARAIGTLVREHAVTFLLATPTFLQAYVRRTEAEDFGSLEFVLAGAEKLPERVAMAFEDKFGIRPVEGYGCTECSPAVAVNTRDFRAPGFRQVGAKRGRIGHPVPGMSVRIVDPDSFAPLALGQPGLLLVRGPNVMQGYLGRPEKTAEVLRDGWYITGDIARLDEDGFIEITDRLSRFSKIGGEMVPHIKVEEKLHELAGATEQTFVVTGVPDAKKGERLVVLHRLPEEELRACLEKLAQSDLPNLWVPRPNQFFRVEAFPYLGTGKLDLRKVRDLALARAGESA